jgi:hypothetical protein
MTAEMNEGGGNRRFPPLVTKVPGVGLVVDVGSQSEDRIDQLKQGHGELTRQIQAALARSPDGIAANPAAEIVPVVLLYRCDQPDYVVITSQS